MAARGSEGGRGVVRRMAEGVNRSGATIRTRLIGDDPRAAGVVAAGGIKFEGIACGREEEKRQRQRLIQGEGYDSGLTSAVALDNYCTALERCKDCWSDATWRGALCSP